MFLLRRDTGAAVELRKESTPFPRARLISAGCSMTLILPPSSSSSLCRNSPIGRGPKPFFASLRPVSCSSALPAPHSSPQVVETTGPQQVAGRHVGLQASSLTWNLQRSVGPQSKLWALEDNQYKALQASSPLWLQALLGRIR